MFCQYCDIYPLLCSCACGVLLLPWFSVSAVMVSYWYDVLLVYWYASACAEMLCWCYGVLKLPSCDTISWHYFWVVMLCQCSDFQRLLWWSSSILMMMIMMCWCLLPYEGFSHANNYDFVCQKENTHNDIREAQLEKDTHDSKEKSECRQRKLIPGI